MLRVLSRSYSTLPALVLALAACGGAGPYGHAPEYAPLGDEKHAAEGSKDFDPVMVQRQPEAWHAVPVSLFGVVLSRTPGPGGAAYLTLSVRRLEPRNLCELASDDSSCRTTVSDKDFGVIHAVVPLRAIDDVGEHSLSKGSLVRVIGTLAQDSDPSDGNLVVRATYYRHWPRYFFVTRSAAATMRQ
jgi:hypothetical protein